MPTRQCFFYGKEIRVKKYLIGIIAVTGLFLIPFFLILGFFGTDTGSSGFQPQTAQERVAKEVADYVTGHGGTLEFAAAWIGNLECESGLNPAKIQGDLPFDDARAYNAAVGGYAIGLGQWDSGRRVHLLQIAKEQRKDWKTTTIQVDFAWNAEGADSELLQRMSKQKSVDQLAIDILNLWERAGTKDNPVEQLKRKTSANNWYLRLTTGGGTISGGKIDCLENIVGQQVNGGQCYGRATRFPISA